MQQIELFLLSSALKEIAPGKNSSVHVLPFIRHSFFICILYRQPFLSIEFVNVYFTCRQLFDLITKNILLLHVTYFVDLKKIVPLNNSSIYVLPFIRRSFFIVCCNGRIYVRIPYFTCCELFDLISQKILLLQQVTHKIFCRLYTIKHKIILRN